MAKRICKLADKSLRKTIDLRDYEDIIIDTINEVVPNKNPIVQSDHFSTDVLSHSQAVKLGFALAEKPEIAKLGILVSIFRLFNGHIVEDEEDKKEKQSNDNNDGNKKISHNRRDPKAILASEQETYQSTGEATSECKGNWE